MSNYLRKSTLKEERFIFVYTFNIFFLGLLGSVVLGLWQDRTSWWGAHVGVKFLTSWWPGSKEREKGWGPNIPFKACPSMI